MGDAKTHYEVIVVGAGVAGIYQIKRLVDLGIDATVLESAGDLGGTWYWNRYPGCRFDSESYTYGFSFSRELLDEWHWKERFSGQPENLRYLNYVADKFDLRKHMQFNCKVQAMHFDETRDLWHVKIGDGRELTSRFVVLAIGLLSAPTMPRLEGLDSFKGRSFHTYYWPHEPVDLAGKKVAVIGTGATGIQLIGEIADKVGELTVFQRRPNWNAPLNNSAISDKEMADIRARYDEIFAACKLTPGSFLHGPQSAGFYEVTREERVALWDKLYDEPGFGIWLANYREIFMDEAANAEFSEYIAGSHPPPGQGSQGRRKTDPEGSRLWRAAPAAGDQIYRGLQPRQCASRRSQRDAARARDRERACAPPRATTNSTSSSTPPGSTPSPAPMT